MAYNSYYPATYQQMAYPVQPQMPQQVYQPQMMPQQQVPQPQQNDRVYFIRVQNESQAKEYIVAPNSSVTFIDDNLPYIYTKTMDASQLDRPKFEKYRLVKEDANLINVGEANDPKENVKYVTVDEFEELKERVNKLSKNRIQKQASDS